MSKGATTTVGLSSGWRAFITITIGGGLVLAALGLWQALAAEGGTDPKKQTLRDIRAAYGTLTTYEIYLAAEAARRLQRGRRAVAGAVTFLLVGVAAIWWAPAAAPSPAAYISVTHGHVVTCGTLQSAGASQLRLIIHGSNSLVTIPFSQVTNLAVTTTCH